MKQYILLLTLISMTVFGQKNVVETKIDKTQNKIGAQFNLTLKTTVDTTANVIFPSNKSFGSLEVIRNYVVDTIKKHNQYQLVKKYGLTQFDSGKYVVPKMTVLINNKPFYSDEVTVHVQDVVVDTLKQKMFDIKPIASIDIPPSNWWKYVLALLLIVITGYWIYYFLKKKQERKLQEEGFATPIEKAISLLKTLEKKELWQKGEIKTYYSELTDIARDYIEEVVEIPAKESTTNELISELKKAVNTKKLKLTKESVSNLERVLKQADLVKFAKSKPLDFEIEEDQKRIEKSIISLHQSIPTETTSENEVLDALQQKELQIKKQRRNRILIAGGFVVGASIGLLIFYIIDKGFYYVKAEVFGSKTEFMLQEKWVYSEYGNPNVGIQTPKVLQRIILPSQQNDPNIKEVQRFMYGSLLDNFYINLITTSYKQEVTTNLDTVISLETKAMEKQFGATITSLNQEDFQTKEGISGKKAIGTLKVVNPTDKSEMKAAFEILIFNQKGGLQEIIITHKIEDIYASQIAKRVLESVELKTASE